MGKYWKVLGVYDSETTAYTALAFTGFASPYTPTETAKLVGLRAIVAAGAATTLIEGFQFKLTSSTFKPNSIEIGGAGSGLHTAPAFAPAAIDFAVDQPVQAGVPITIEGRNVTAETPVTVEIIIMGCFVN